MGEHREGKGPAPRDLVPQPVPEEDADPPQAVEHRRAQALPDEHERAADDRRGPEDHGGRPVAEHRAPAEEDPARRELEDHEQEPHHHDRRPEAGDERPGAPSPAREIHT
jgi:hypothetical protein